MVSVDDLAVGGSVGALPKHHHKVKNFVAAVGCDEVVVVAVVVQDMPVQEQDSQNLMAVDGGEKNYIVVAGVVVVGQVHTLPDSLFAPH